MTQVGNAFWITTEKGDQLRPAVTYLAASKKYLVVWRSPAPLGGYGTYGRLVEEHTGVNKTTIEISEKTFAIFLFKPAVGHVAVDYSTIDKTALVVWSESTILGGRIKGRLVASDGKPKGGSFEISSGWHQVWDDAYIRVAWNAKTNLYLVAWDGKNQKGWRTPRSALVDAKGTVKTSAIVGDATGKVTQPLQGLCPDPTSGQWLVTYEEYCRLVASNGTVASSPITRPNTLRMFDAVPTTSGFRVIGCEPFMTNKLRVWTGVLTSTGFWSGTPDVAYTTYAMQWATAASNPSLATWLMLYGHDYAKNVGTEVVCRKFDTAGNDVDGKPFGVVDASDYEPTNGRAAVVANSSNNESLVVWSYRRHSPAGWVTNHVMGSIIDTQDGLIVVEDEAGKKIPWAYVSINGKWAGFTNASGWLARPLKKDDEVAARKLVHVGAAKKAGHDPFGSGSNWAYHVWLTSVRIENNGTAGVWKVVDPSQTQVVTIRKDNALIGYNLVVSFQWDPSSMEMATARTYLRTANDYLYNVTDGQLTLEFIRINPNQKEWGNADVKILAGTGRSDCNCPISNPPSHVRMYWLGQGSLDAGVWTHELLHYLANLGDEYEEGKQYEICTQRLVTDSTGPYASGGAKSSCPMSGMHTHGPWELCTNLAANPHYKKTQQGSTTCWDTLSYFLSGSNWAPSNGRWQLRTPNTRGGVIVEGPKQMPVAEWSRIDNPTSHDPVRGEPPEWEARLAYPELSAEVAIEVEERPTVSVEVMDRDGRPRRADLWLEYPARMVRLGSTGTDGRLDFTLGALPLRIHATSYQPDGDHLERADRIVAPGSIRLEVSRQSTELGIRLTPTPDPFVVGVLVTADRQLRREPELYASPHGLPGSIWIPLTYSPRAGGYLGTFHQEPGSEDGGVMWARVASEDDLALALVEYRISTLDPGVCKKLGSGDGMATLVLGPGTEAQTVAAITRARLPVPPSRRVEIVGGPYDLAATAPHVAGMFRYFPPRPHDPIDTETIGIVRWDEDARRWEWLPTTWNSRLGFAAAEVALWEAGEFHDPRSVYAVITGR